MPNPHPNKSRVFHAMLGCLLLTGMVRSATGQIVINEFLFRDPDTRLEFIEIFNTSANAVDLDDVAVSDERKSRVRIGDVVNRLEPGAYAVIVRDSSAFDARFSGPRSRLPSWPALNNSGDAIFLWAGGVPIDSVFFDDDWGAYGQSMERVDPRAPAVSRANWKGSEHPSGGTPGALNSVYLPDRTPPSILEAEEWIDGRVIVYLSEPLDPESLKSARIQFASGDRPLSARLSSDRTQVILEPWSDADLTALTLEGLVDDAGNSAGAEGINIARQPGPSDVILNEILFEPSTDAFDGLPDQVEFVEIRSLADYPIALRRMYLTGPENERGSSDTLWSDDRPMRIRTGGFAFFYASGSGAAFREAFPSTPPDSVAAGLPMRRQSLLLDNNGDTVKLHSARGDILDELTYTSAWHLPERPTTRGVSLERISELAATNDSDNWTSSVSAEGATPGRMNSVAAPEGGDALENLVVTPSPFSPDGDGFEDFARIQVTTGRATSSVAVWIFDAAGRRVRNLEDALFIGNEVSIIWDGRDDADHSLPPGVFIVYVESVDTAAGDVSRYKRPIVIAPSR